jgi:hypothetical protein
VGLHPACPQPDCGFTSAEAATAQGHTCVAALQLVLLAFLDLDGGVLYTGKELTTTRYLTEDGDCHTTVHHHVKCNC